MSDLSDYLENELLDHIFGVGSWSAPASRHVALFTAAPTDAGGGTEVANSNGYARQTLTTGTAAASGSISNTAAVTFTASGGGWGTIVAIGIYDSGTHGAGNLLWWKTLAPVTINDTDSIQWGIGDLTFSLN